jgi:hypothetical protein
LASGGGLRVGLKFCGNCNPLLDIHALLQALKTNLSEASFVSFADEGGYDVLLVLSSCPSDCATRPPFAGPVIEVTSASVNRWPVPEGDLADVISSLCRAARDH